MGGRGGHRVLSGQRVLILDANPATRVSLSERLERHGHDCRCVDTRASALGLIASFLPTVFIFDWIVGSESLDGVAAAVRANGRALGLEIEVVLFSEHAAPTDYLHREAIDHFVSKQSDGDELARVLEKRR